MRFLANASGRQEVEDVSIEAEDDEDAREDLRHVQKGHDEEEEATLDRSLQESA